MVYTAKIGGKTRRVVSVATMEGMWFAYDAETGAPIYQRVKVIDNVEHPALSPGQAGRRLSRPRSAASTTRPPRTTRRRTTSTTRRPRPASALQQQTPAQEQSQQLLARQHVPRASRTATSASTSSRGWKDYGSISAIDVHTGKVVWKFQTPQPERGGVTTTASGLGFVGGGDGVLRAFDAKTGNVLWKFQTGFQIASGPSVYSVNGTEFVAITVGGTTTSSSGGTVASQLQVFGLGGSQTQSTGPDVRDDAARERSTAMRLHTVASARHRTRPRAGAGPAARIVTPGAVQIQPWDPNTSNTQDVQGRVTLAGKPVAGVAVRIDGWVAPAHRQGRRRSPTRPTTRCPGGTSSPSRARRDATVDGQASTRGRAEPGHRRRRAGSASATRSPTCPTRPGPEGTIVLSGRVTYGKGLAPRPVQLYSYELTRHGHRREREPGKGAIVTTRTGDHKFWTFSAPTGREREVHLVPRRRRPGGRRPGPDDRRASPSARTRTPSRWSTP